MPKLSQSDRAALKSYLNARTNYDAYTLQINRNGMATAKMCRDKRPHYQPYIRVNIGWYQDVLRDARAA